MENKKIAYPVIVLAAIVFLFTLAATCSLCSIKIESDPALLSTSIAEETDNITSESNSENEKDRNDETDNSIKPEATSAESLVNKDKNNNKDPEIISINFPVPGTNTNCQFIVYAVDQDSDSLTYEWNASDGTIVDVTGNNMTWLAPNTAGDYTIELKVTDGKGGEDREIIKINLPDATNKILWAAVENECGYIYMDRFTNNAVVDNGNPVYTGDTDNGSWVKAFISFDIGVFPGLKVKSAELTLKINTIRNDPSFFTKAWLCQSVNNWGSNPIKGEDFNLNGNILQEYSSSGDGNIVCNNEALVKAIQEDMDNNSARTQFVLLFYPVGDSEPGVNNGIPDGWLYYTNDMSLFVEYYQ